MPSGNERVEEKKLIRAKKSYDCPRPDLAGPKHVKATTMHPEQAKRACASRTQPYVSSILCVRECRRERRRGNIFRRCDTCIKFEKGEAKVHHKQKSPCQTQRNIFSNECLSLPQPNAASNPSLLHVSTAVRAATRYHN